MGRTKSDKTEKGLRSASRVLQTDQKQPTVLIVDDNQSNVELLQAYLKGIDCETTPAYSGLEALKIVKKKVPDLILLDVMMPQMSGFEVCKRIKNDPKTSHIPIIMVTALTDLADVERGVDSGTDDFLSKPVNKWELITRVKTMLKLKHLSDQLERTLAYLSEIEKQAASEAPRTQ